MNPRARRTEIFSVIVYEIGSTLPPMINLLAQWRGNGSPKGGLPAGERVYVLNCFV